MPIRKDHVYQQFLRMIKEGQSQEVVQKILEFDDKAEQVYTVSRLYKGIYPHLDSLLDRSTHTDLYNIVKAVEANAFLFDLSLSLIEQTDINLDIRSDLQHARTLKRMIAYAFKEAIDLDYALDDPLIIELNAARTILQTIINSLKSIVQIP